jgi:transposase
MRKYSQEFKESTIQLVLNSKEATKKIAKDLDVHEKTLYAWVKAYKEANNIAVEKQGEGKQKSIVKESEAEELKRLRKENRILKQERDILKKATAYFAKETL